MSCCSPGGEIFVFPSNLDREQEGAEEMPADPPALHRFDEAVLGAFGEEGRHKLGRRSLPWVAMVPEDEVDGWVERLNRRPDIVAACPNWTLTLASDPFAPAGDAILDPGHTLRFLENNVPTHLSHFEAGGGIHVAVIDSGIAAGSVAPRSLAEDQIDFAALGSSLRTPPLDTYGHGSLVASLIHLLAPNARITSIRCFKGRSATLSDVVYGLLSLMLLDEPVHLVNLSLSLGAATERCRHCGTPATRPGEPRRQVAAILAELGRTTYRCPLFVAAAGDRRQLAVPAGIDGVVAVASAKSTRPVEVEVEHNPEEEFVLAPGGSQAEPVSTSLPAFNGSSFATAIATGVLARNLADLDPCLQASWSVRPGTQRQLLAGLADRAFPGYNPTRHGLGLLH